MHKNIFTNALIFRNGINLCSVAFRHYESVDVPINLLVYDAV